MASSNKNPPLGSLKSARYWHVYYVYKDKDFVKACKAIDKTNEPYVRHKIAKDFSITPWDVFYYETSKIIYLGHNIKRNGEMTFDPKQKKYILKFDFEITKSEFMEYWEMFARIRKTFVGELKVKRKPPENPELIYAIFKARKKHTFRRIFEMLSNGKLPSYSGSPNQFKSEDALERYYNKYKPAT